MQPSPCYTWQSWQACAAGERSLGGCYCWLCQFCLWAASTCLLLKVSASASPKWHALLQDFLLKLVVGFYKNPNAVAVTAAFPVPYMTVMAGLCYWAALPRWLCCWLCQCRRDAAFCCQRYLWLPLTQNGMPCLKHVGGSYKRSFIDCKILRL